MVKRENNKGNFKKGGAYKKGSGDKNKSGGNSKKTVEVAPLKGYNKGFNKGHNKNLNFKSNKDHKNEFNYKNNKRNSTRPTKNNRKHNNEDYELNKNIENNKDEIQVDNNTFFDFDGDTSILNKLKSKTTTRNKNNTGSVWSYKNVIQNEKDMRKIREQQTKEETKNSDLKMQIDDEREPEEKVESAQQNEMNEEEDDYNSNNVNKFESDIYSKDASFCDFNLSKIILKGLANLEYFHPTKVQEKVIPLILRGHDVLVNAETGSGKTGCFLLPIIQKIITNKSTRTPIRALIILPTRELAYQCQEMLNSFTKYLEEVTSVSICGGMSIDSQINSLKLSPDILIATPGRLIDMLYNYKSVNNFLDDINILVLDEADKLLELGFKDAIVEIINMIKENKNRQTLLFSATLNTKIIDLGKDTLKNPVKVKMNKSAILTNLKQSLVRMRFKIEEGTDETIFEKRMAYLINLLTDDKNVKLASRFRSIIFFNTKKECHKAVLTMKKFNINASELHSDIPQPERLRSLDEFQKGNIKYLLCTDIAARGIDVEKVRCVINFQMPLLEDRYIHRIGRTARKGYQGEAITICDEKERQNLKKLLKKENFVIANIILDNSAVKATYKTLNTYKSEISQLVEDDLIERELLQSEKDIEKTINMKVHQNEIYNKPKKTWFLSKFEKKDLRKKITTEMKNNKME